MNIVSFEFTVRLNTVLTQEQTLLLLEIDGVSEVNRDSAFGDHVVFIGDDPEVVKTIETRFTLELDEIIRSIKLTSRSTAKTKESDMKESDADEKVREAAARVLRRVLSPGDYVAVEATYSSRSRHVRLFAEADGLYTEITGLAACLLKRRIYKHGFDSGAGIGSCPMAHVVGDLSQELYSELEHSRYVLKPTKY